METSASPRSSSVAGWRVAEQTAPASWRRLGLSLLVLALIVWWGC
jgi:hypothetical protein